MATNAPSKEVQAKLEAALANPKVEKAFINGKGKLQIFWKKAEAKPTQATPPQSASVATGGSGAGKASESTTSGASSEGSEVSPVVVVVAVVAVVGAGIAAWLFTREKKP